MIVDDSPMARRWLKTILVDAGHEVVFEAGDGATAVLNYREHSPDLVTMDITMPVMDGMSAARKILNQHPSARIVMVSSLKDQEKVVEACQAGALYYISKPYEAARVLQIIKDVTGA